MNEGRGWLGAFARGLVLVLCACGGGGGTDAGSDAGSTPPRIVSFFASPSNVRWDGGTTTLMFDTSGAASLSIAPGVGDVSGRSSQQVTVLQDTTFTLTATNAAGSVMATAFVDVDAPPMMFPAPVISSFTAMPAMLPSDGGTSTLRWTVSDADISMTIDQGVGDVSMRSSVPVNVTATRTYTLTAVGRGGMATRMATVTVLPPPPGICAPDVLVAPALAANGFVRSLSLGAARAILTWGGNNVARYSFFDGATWSAPVSPSALTGALVPSLSRDPAGNAYLGIGGLMGGDVWFIDGTTGARGASTMLAGGAPGVTGATTGAYAFAFNGTAVREYDRAGGTWNMLSTPAAAPATAFRITTGLGGHTVATWVGPTGLFGFAYRNGGGWDPAVHYTMGFDRLFPVHAVGMLRNGDFVVVWQDVGYGGRTWLQKYRRAQGTFELPRLLHEAPTQLAGAQVQVFVDDRDRVTALYGVSLGATQPVFVSRDFGVAMQPAVQIANGAVVATAFDANTGNLAVAYGNPLVVAWSAASSPTWHGPFPTYLTPNPSSGSYTAAFGVDGHVLVSFLNATREVRSADCIAAPGGFDGGAPFVPDAGAEVDAGVPSYTFQVVTLGDRPVPGAYALLVGPSLRRTAVANANGDLAIDWPVTERPFDLTVVAAGYEAVSVLGITTELPARIRTDATVFAAPTALVSGSITGKASAANRVTIDLIDGLTPAPVFAATWSTQYLIDSPHPITVVALELDAMGNTINWTKTTVARPAAGGAVTANLAFPATPNTFRSTSHTVTVAPSGLLSGNALMGSQTNGTVASYLFSPGLESYVVSGVVTGSGTTVTARGIDDVMGPNRLTHAVPVAAGSLFVNLWVVDPFSTAASSTALPVVTQLSTTGFSLADVAVSAAGTGFDTLALQISANGTTYWRVYTAPGAPLAARLPDLPSGFHPDNIMPNVAPSALALLIKLESPAFRPWMLQGGDVSSVQYRVTVGGSYTNVQPTWR